MVKVAKKVKGDKDKVSYVLRCLWHILNDPKADKVMKWHAELPNAFVVAKEDEICAFFDTYEDFQTNYFTFRRSLYLYGFKKSRNSWSHPMLAKGDEDCLKRIIRQKKLSKKKQIQHLQSLTQMFMGQRSGYPQMYMHPHAFPQSMGVANSTPLPGFYPSFQAPKITKDESGRNIYIPPSTYNHLPAPIMQRHPLESYNSLDAAHYIMNPATPIQELNMQEQLVIKSESENN